MGNRLPFMQWYPNDIRGEAGYRICSLAARGLWRDLLDVMWTCPERGVLKTGSLVWGVKEIAAEVGSSFTEIERALAELKATGIYSVTEDGAIYNRRMVREERERQLAAARQQKCRSRKSVTETCHADVTPDISEVRSHINQSQNLGGSAASSPHFSVEKQTLTPKARYAVIGKLAKAAEEISFRNEGDPKYSRTDLADDLKTYAAQNHLPYFDALPGAATPIEAAITICEQSRLMRNAGKNQAIA